MDDDVTSTATMTSVTEEFSSDESDEVTANDFETSSLVTTSDACEEGNTTVIHTSCMQTLYSKVHSDPGKGVERDDSKNKKPVTCTVDSSQLTSSASPAFSNEKNSPLGTKDHPKQPGHTKSARPSEKDFPFSALHSEPGPWYSHSCFHHYWRHYQFVSLWCQKHMEIYKSMVEQHWKVAAQQQGSRQVQKDGRQQPRAPPIFKKPMSMSNRTAQNRKARRRRKATKKRLRMAMKNAQLAGSCSVLSVSSEEEGNNKVEASEGGETTELSAGDLTDDEMHMEISEEMLDFFAHTHKHRQERDAMKRNSKATEAEEKHINIEEVRGDKKGRTASAPTERPGAKRTSQMRYLFGKGAAMIHGMETALQMTFDRNLDILQPKLWPNMPFRVIFD